MSIVNVINLFQVKLVMKYLFPYPQVRPYQGEFMDAVFDAVSAGKQLLVHAPTGVGKCVSGETLILTEKGLVKIKDLYQKNMKVNTLNENLKISLEKGYVVKKKRSRLFELKTRMGRIIEATSDHKFLSIEKGCFSWKKLEDLGADDFIGCARKLELVKSDLDLTLDLVDDLNDYYKKKIKLKIDPSISYLLKEIKEKTDMGSRRLACLFGCDRKHIVQAFRGELISFDLVCRILDYCNINKKDVNITEVGYKFSPKKVKVKVDKDLSYLFGLLMGDGCILSIKRDIILSSVDESLLDFFKSYGRKLGSNVFKKGGKRKNCDWIMVNKPFALLLVLLGFKVGKKSHNVFIPDIFFKDKTVLRQLLRGLFDADGTASGGVIEYSTRSEKLMRSLLTSLLIFGIYPNIKEKYVKGVKYYRIFILNSQDKRTFLTKIGFSLRRKQEELRAGIKETNHNLDIIPGIRNLIKRCRYELNVSYSRDRDFRIYESYIYGFRNPSRERLKSLIANFKSGSQGGKNTYYLEKLCDSDIFWDEIVSIKFKKRDWVYDATVPGFGNFVGNGIILHNTSAVLAPALKFAIENKKTVFFLTSRNTQHILAVETLKEVKKKFGLDIVAVDLIGKKGMCNQNSIEMLTSSEFVEYCKNLREKGTCKYYNNIKKNGKLAVEAGLLLDNLKEKSPDFVQDFCARCDDHCAYEMALVMSKKAHVLVADYNYALNPMIRKGLMLRMNKQLEDCIFIFDEAHNLPGRARELLSAGVSTNVLGLAAKECKEFGYPEVAGNLDKIREGLLSFGKYLKGEKMLAKKDFSGLVESVCSYEDLIGSLSFISDVVLEKKKRSYALYVANFLSSWVGPDDGFVRVFKRVYGKGNEFFKLEYKCLSPDLALAEVISESYSFIGMSGTLNPLGMYVDLLGLRDCKLLEFPCPFPKENRLNIVLPRTSTKYKSRSPMMYKQIAELCANVCNSVKGNVAVFFPSYSLRDEVYRFFMDECEKTILLEYNSGGDELRKKLLRKFEGYKSQGAVLFAVAGGSFSEGVDFPGDLLNGVVVVGLPLAPPDIETKELINYYDRKYARGWDYGYVIPAIIKAVQSSGRCIRSETDKGVVVFIDERYMWKNYFGCFPTDWNIVVDPNPVDRILEFYNNKK